MPQAQLTTLAGGDELLMRVPDLSSAADLNRVTRLPRVAPVATIIVLALRAR